MQLDYSARYCTPPNDLLTRQPRSGSRTGARESFGSSSTRPAGLISRTVLPVSPRSGPATGIAPALPGPRAWSARSWPTPLHQPPGLKSPAHGRSPRRRSRRRTWPRHHDALELPGQVDLLRADRVPADHRRRNLPPGSAAPRRGERPPVHPPPARDPAYKVLREDAGFLSMEQMLQPSADVDGVSAEG